MKINPKSEKGAITLIVLVAMLFLTIILMSLYIRIANKAQTSAENTKQIEEKYNNIGEADNIYASYFASGDVIPIYTRAQLEKIGSGEQVTINGKIYIFSSNAYYTLKNDLDLGGYYDETTGAWTAAAGDEWIPITNDFTGVLDGLGHTISGIYLGTDEGKKGIFKELNGTVKNLYIKNSYKITNMNGLIAGTNNGEIINCYYEKIMIGLKTGDYVNYTPDTGTYTVASGETGSGYTSSQSFTTETGISALKWRILSLNEKTGEIELVSATAGPTLYLTGVEGYNHGVDILNDLCEKLYSKTVSGTKVATGRSINVKDINAKTTYDYTTFIRTDTGFKYGDKKQLSNYGTGYRKYPKLYSQEIGYGTKGKFNTTGLDEETRLKNGTTANGVTTYPAMGYIDGNTSGTDPYITLTYYGYNGSSDTYCPDQCLNTSLGINTAPIGLISLDSKYWLASRCIGAYTTSAMYCVRDMNYGYVGYYIVFRISTVPRTIVITLSAQ